jgi:excisionase family DNA binding protein
MSHQPQFPLLQLDPVNDTIVTVREAADHYKVSVPTVWRWVLSGKVDSIKVGNSRRTSLEAISRAFTAS